jgi:hypothetical protein
MHEQPSPRRRWLALALVVVATLLAFAALFSIWVNRQFLNTDNWTDSSSRLLERPVVRDRVADYLTDQLYANVDVEGLIREGLPERAQVLAGPAAGALRTLVNRRAKEALATEKVQQLWEDSNRTAHQALVQLLEGGGPVLSTTGGNVVIDLRALLQETENRAGFGGRLEQKLPENAAQVTVMRSDQLGTAQDILKAVKALPIVLVVLSLALFGLALLVAPGWRRRAVRAYGIGLIVAGVASLAALSLLRDDVADSLAQTAAGIPVVQAVWDIYSTLLKQVATATIGYGVVLLAGAWFAGPTRPAVAVRRALAPYMREPAIVYGVSAVVLAVVVLWWSPTPATRNPVTGTALVALLLLGIEGLRRKTVREFPDAERVGLLAMGREHFGRLASGAVGGVRSGSAAVVRQAGSFAPATPVPDPDARLERLERLERLRASGVLDDDEARAEKARILQDENGVDAPANTT